MVSQIKIQTRFKGYPSITAELEELVEKSGVKSGICLLSLPDTTAALGITSFWDSRGLDDLLDEIDRSFPARVSYKNQQSPYAASGNVKSPFIGTNNIIPIKEGKLLLGSSQGVVLLEFDGPRPRECNVQLLEKNIKIKKGALLTQRMGMHDITTDIEGMVKEMAVDKGICHISMPHSTAGILLCKNDKAVMNDIMDDIEKMVPTRVDFKHRETAADAGGHVKTVFAGNQISLPIQEGKLMISPDQGVIFAEFDGPRPRSFFVSVIQK